MSPDDKLEDSLFGVVLQDSYKITGLLGVGGMGAVYDALQVRLNKRDEHPFRQPDPDR